MENAKNLPLIMVVDDDVGILRAIRRQLEITRLYQVEIFESPEAALVHAGNVQFDLLITDYKMPLMHGLTFMNKFTQLQPNTPTVVISGDADRALRHSDFNDIHIPYLLRKPWPASELLEIVERALSEGPVK